MIGQRPSSSFPQPQIAVFDADSAQIPSAAPHRRRTDSGRLARTWATQPVPAIIARGQRHRDSGGDPDARRPPPRPSRLPGPRPRLRPRMTRDLSSQRGNQDAGLPATPPKSAPPAAEASRDEPGPSGGHDIAHTPMTTGAGLPGGQASTRPTLRPDPRHAHAADIRPGPSASEARDHSSDREAAATRRPVQHHGPRRVLGPVRTSHAATEPGRVANRRDHVRPGSVDGDDARARSRVARRTATAAPEPDAVNRPRAAAKATGAVERPDAAATTPGTSVTTSRALRWPHDASRPGAAPPDTVVDALSGTATTTPDATSQRQAPTPRHAATAQPDAATVTPGATPQRNPAAVMPRAFPQPDAAPTGASRTLSTAARPDRTGTDASRRSHRSLQSESHSRGDSLNSAPATITSRPEPTPHSRPRLLEQVSRAVRARQYSQRTESAYVGWVRRFVLFHGKKHPSDLDESAVVAFLTYLANECTVSTFNAESGGQRHTLPVQGSARNGHGTTPGCRPSSKAATTSSRAHQGGSQGRTAGDRRYQAPRCLLALWGWSSPAGSTSTTHEGRRYRTTRDHRSPW